MEDLHGTHKQVPFGWVLWLGAAITRARPNMPADKLMRFERLAAGLHQPSAPH
jgi:hypothetical protein